MQISIVIPGRIGGKGRPRFSTRGGFVRAFTDAKTVNTEALIRQFASDAMAGKPLFDGPVYLSMLITINPPASWSNKKRASALYVTGKPDGDNLIKVVSDSFNGIVWRDDSQVCDILFSRRYSITSREQVAIVIADAEMPALFREVAA